MDISSSAVRERVANQQSLEQMVCQGVRDYIEQHRLYLPASVQ